MRLFIAIQLNEEFKDALEDIQDAMWDAGMDGRFTSRENLHITLAFIGEYGDVERVKDVVERVSVKPFSIGISGIGAFGDLWWAGVASVAELTGLAKRLRRALAEAGIPFDKKAFRPHITLVRRAEGAERLTGTIRTGDTVMTVDHISLMRSDRGKGGMIYTEIARSR